MEFKIIKVTPEIAESWLGKNTSNRNIRPRIVTKYAADMKAGKWQMTGEAIKFGQSGRLIDGQHRLLAVISARCTVSMVVACGVEDVAQSVMDTCTTRTAADGLSMGGYHNTALMAAIARRRISIRSANTVSHSHVYDYVETHPEIVEATRLARRYGTPCGITSSTVGVAAFMIRDVYDWETAESFFRAAAEKVGLAAGDPVLAMTAFFAEKARLRHMLPLEVQLSIIIRCFNYRMTNRSLKLLRIKSSAASAEVIPIPVVQKVTKNTIESEK